MIRRTIKTSFALVLLLVLLLASIHVEASNIKCQFEAISQHVYVISGSDNSACPSKTLQHPVTNPTAIIGTNGVVIVDPGSSEQVGELVVNRLRLITNKPVVAIINTHIHGLYWLANHAVKKAFPRALIYAHPTMIKRLKNGEDAYWVDAITGNTKGQKTKIAVPSIAINKTQIVTIAGIKLKIYVLGIAHTDHDLLIEIIDDQVLILGGLVVEPEVPSQGVPEDANFKKQIEATKYVIKLNMKTYIPGQGLPQGIELPKRALRFLQNIYQLVEHYYALGLQDFEITEKIKLDLAEFKQWYHFDALGRVISVIYTQVEQESF